jgi:hypothetical protein
MRLWNKRAIKDDKIMVRTSSLKKKHRAPDERIIQYCFNGFEAR